MVRSLKVNGIQGSESLNFHHLRYFWAVARDGNLTRTARRLRVSQSALSAQIRQLEGAIGHELFVREGRSLALTEAGRLALAHADDIFARGDELVATLSGGRAEADVLGVGAVATLSRNFLDSFLAPLLGDARARLRLRSGGLADLTERLEAHDLDVVLSNRPVFRESGRALRCRRLARQCVSLVGRPRARPFRFATDLRRASLIVPGPDSEIRTEFDALCEQRGLSVTIAAEVDDMATLRLLARDTNAIALVPSIVVRDELRAGVLAELCVVPSLHESFYAITAARRFQHPRLAALLARAEPELLAEAP
jgi:LysR family transcriptional activator of nhaA